MQDTLIIWDWDGTVVDNTKTGASALIDMAAHFGLTPPTKEDIECVMTAVKSPYWTQFGDDWKTYSGYFLERFQHYANTNGLVVFEGVEETMAWLNAQGARQVVISNKPHEMLQEDYQRTSLKQYLLKACGMSFEDGLSKPQKEYAEKSLRGISYKKLHMIGDSNMDMLFAQNIEANAINVSPNAKPNKGYAVVSHRNLLKYVQQVFTRC